MILRFFTGTAAQCSAGQQSQSRTLPRRPTSRRRVDGADESDDAGTPSARRFLLIELVITTIVAAIAAGVNVPIVGSSDSAAKKEDREADGAPPKAEEQA